VGGYKFGQVFLFYENSHIQTHEFIIGTIVYLYKDLHMPSFDEWQLYALYVLAYDSERLRLRYLRPDNLMDLTI
jgi:hypothetical protein